MGELGQVLATTPSGEDASAQDQSTNTDVTELNVGKEHPANPRQQLIRQAQAAVEATSYISIRGTYRRHCLVSCLCDCHSRMTRRASPAWMTKVLGSFFLSYDCLPIVDPRACNLETCLNYNNLIRLAWHLPSWAWARALIMAIQTTETFGLGMRIWLEIPKIIPYSHPIWTPWGKQPDQWMVDLLMTDKINPNDCDSTGQTVLYVRVRRVI